MSAFERTLKQHLVSYRIASFSVFLLSLLFIFLSFPFPPFSFSVLPFLASGLLSFVPGTGWCEYDDAARLTGAISNARRLLHSVGSSVVPGNCPLMESDKKCTTRLIQSKFGILSKVNYYIFYKPIEYCHILVFVIGLCRTENRRHYYSHHCHLTYLYY